MSGQNLDDRNLIDQLCDKFDYTWVEHSPESIANLLAMVPASIRSNLIRELILIDQEHCHKSESPVRLETYLQYFPDQSNLINELISERESAGRQDDPSIVESTAVRAWPKLKDQAQVGSYQVSDVIGKGGMGVVYRAVHKQLGRAVALKIVALPLAEAGLRFQAEARMIAGLNHPHIVQIYETGDYENRPYLVLELMQGGSLDDLLRNGVLEPRHAAKIVSQIASALIAAHQIGIVHRDLKPANVLLDNAGKAKLADFGLARDLKLDGQTMPGTLLGTPGFMAPEQTTGSDPEPALDIYGLGAVLYAGLTGRPPFRGANIPDTLTMVRDQDPLPVRALEPAVPIDLESICLKCLQKNPAARYASAAEVDQDLKAFLAGMPIKARPPGRLGKLWRWSLRNPAIAVLSCVLLLAVNVGLSGIVWQWRRAEANATRYQQEAIHAEAETATKEAVNAFMQTVMSAAQASRLGRDATVREAMDEAAEHLHEFFPDRPQVEAAIRMTLGETYRSMDQPSRSIEQFQMALSLYQHTLGEFDTHSLSAMNGLAGALRAFGDRDDMAEAAELRELVLQERLRTLGETHPATITAMNNLGTVLLDIGELDRAAKLYQRLLSVVGKHPDSKESDAFIARFNLATIYEARGELDLAETGVRDFLQNIADNPNSIEQPDVEILNARNTLAGILLKQGKPDEAETLYREVLTERRVVLGTDHLHTLSTFRRLTRLLVDTKEFEKALPLLQQCLTIHNERFGVAAGLTFGVRKSIATVLRGLKRDSEMEQFLRETVTLLTENRGQNHRYTQEARTMLKQLTAGPKN